ncbi:MAG: hypothetical protein CBB97_25020 [Candidatus Endolissoclinum sp. TMED37]|nr:MAG: hypothetical protein CBB97_25020 [Candidatus Endolissoclinum sp. TMED37]
MSVALAPMPQIPAVNSPGITGTTIASVGANSVPNLRQTMNGVLPVTRLNHSVPFQPQRQPVIASPRLSPSTISTEQALASRAQLAPEFMHNVLSTRILRTSNLYADMPRFRNQLDILA